MIRQVDWERIRSVCSDVVFDIPTNVDISTKDAKTIADALKRSTWLRRNIHSLYRLYKWLPRLASGYYDDYTKIQNTDNDCVICERLSSEDLENLFTILGDNKL